MVTLKSNIYLQVAFRASARVGTRQNRLQHLKSSNKIALYFQFQVSIYRGVRVGGRGLVSLFSGGVRACVCGAGVNNLQFRWSPNALGLDGRVRTRSGRKPTDGAESSSGNVRSLTESISPLIWYKKTELFRRRLRGKSRFRIAFTLLRFASLLAEDTFLQRFPATPTGFDGPIALRV